MPVADDDRMLCLWQMVPLVHDNPLLVLCILSRDFKLLDMKEYLVLTLAFIIIIIILIIIIIWFF